MSEPTEARTIDAIQADIECAVLGKAAAAIRVKAVQGDAYNARLRASIDSDNAAMTLFTLFCELRNVFENPDPILLDREKK